MARLLTPEQVAKRLHVTKQTVWKWIREGHLPARRFGQRMYRINEADLAVMRVGPAREDFLKWAKGVEQRKADLAKRHGRHEDSTPRLREEREGR